MAVKKDGRMESSPRIAEWNGPYRLPYVSASVLLGFRSFSPVSARGANTRDLTRYTAQLTLPAYFAYTTGLTLRETNRETSATMTA